MLHAVLHKQKNYHSFTFKFLIKQFAEMKSVRIGVLNTFLNPKVKKNIYRMYIIHYTYDDVYGRLHADQSLSLNLKTLFSDQSWLMWLMNRHTNDWGIRILYHTSPIYASLFPDSWRSDTMIYDLCIQYWNQKYVQIVQAQWIQLRTVIWYHRQHDPNKDHKLLQ